MSISTFRTLAFVAFAVITAPLFSQGTCEIEGLFTSPAFEECGDELQHDGYHYATVQIGDQCWFQENLRSEHYRGGDSIPGNLSDGEWSTTEAGAQAYYDNAAGNLTYYGRLYNWYAVNDDRGLCPSGWHVPTDGEFMMLEMELGMSESEANGVNSRGTNQGMQLKSSSDDFPSWNGTNTSGFSGLAGGVRYGDGSFYLLSSHVYFWSASSSGVQAWYRNLYTNNSEVSRNYFGHRGGFSVRCAIDFTDDCGVLNGDNSSCAGCDGVANSGLVNDDCGVCGGDNSTCADDGSSSETDADGTVFTNNADGSGSAVYTDGSTETWDGQGGGSWDDGQGNTSTWNADGSGSYTDSVGGSGSWSADGSSVNTEADGTIWLYNADGSGSVTYTDGTVESWPAP